MFYLYYSIYFIQRPNLFLYVTLLLSTSNARVPTHMTGSKFRTFQHHKNQKNPSTHLA